MSDLVTLAEQLRKFDLENGLDLALEMRKARRERYSARAKKGRATLRATRFRAAHEAAARLRPPGFNRAHGGGA